MTASPRKLLILLLLLAAAAVRLGGINCQLWLDEIWSIRWAQTCRSPLDVFTLHHDNNHWLNTLWLYCLGPGRPWWAYHLLAEVTGIGTVLVGWIIGRRRGPWQGVAVLILLGASEFLVEFSSEARGYAPAGFFTLASVWLLERQIARPRGWTGLALAVSALLGILSHLTFLVVLGGLITASVLSVVRRKTPSRDLVQILLWCVIPLGGLALLYFVDLRLMIRGRGPPTPDDLPSQTAAMVLGIPVGHPAAPIFGVLAMIFCAMGVVRLYRAADPTWPIFALALLFVPAVLYCVPRSDYVYPRYVYVVVPLLMLALGLEFGQWLTSARPRLPALLLLAGFILINTRSIIHFLAMGRGDYLGAVAYMAGGTRGYNLGVAAVEHPGSTITVVQYYEEYSLHRDHHIAPFLGKMSSFAWPQWVISENDLDQAYPVLGTRVVYLRKAVFPCGAVTSGLTWYVYEAALRR